MVCPIPIPPEVADQGDPVEIFKTLAPHDDVPKELYAARERAEVFVRRHPELLRTAPRDRSGEHNDERFESVQQKLESANVHETGRVGSTDCPWTFFGTAKSAAGRAFCPGNTSNSMCLRT
jgi:hypothetical protein